jgi:hypothetical protein
MFRHSTNAVSFFSVFIAALIFSLSLAGVAAAQSNTSLGSGALQSNTTGRDNTAIGVGADVSAGNLTNATAIGFGAVVNASNKIHLGNTGVTVIEGQVAFTAVSDKTKKENFQPGMEKKCWERFAPLSFRAGTSLATIPRSFATMVRWRKTSLRPSATMD